MGNGQVPGPVDDLGEPILIDEGTLARFESPSPGPIGLQSKGGSAKQSQPSMADRIVGFARRRLTERVGDGECFTLADRALRAAGAKSAADFGDVSPNADYVWGASVNLSDLRPGDVIQFRDYQYEREIETEHPDGSAETVTDVQQRPHHTAIVERVDGHGGVTVLEQNSPDGAPVVRTQLFFRSRTITDGNRTTTITVQGTFRFYRPEAR